MIWSVILFLPLVLALVLFGVSFAKKGYKKGPWRALICLAVTVITAILSCLVAVKAAQALTALITGSLTATIPPSGVMAAILVKVVAARVIQVLVALLVFGLAFCVLRPILAGLSKLIKVPQWDEKEDEDSKPRLAGMGIRIVDGVLVALLVLLPLYGIIMVGAGPAALVLNGEVPVVDQAAEHPVRYVYQYGPVAPVLNTLTRVTVNDTKVNLMEVSTSVGNMKEPVTQLLDAGGNPLVLFQALNNEVFHSGWCYHFTMELMSELEMALTDEAVAQQLGIKPEYIQFLRLNEEDFRKGIQAIAEVADVIMKYNLQDSLLNPDMAMELPEGFLEELGTLMNSNETVLELKETVIRNGLQTFMEMEGRENPAQEAEKIIKEHFGDGKVPEELRQAEAESLLLILRAKDLDAMKEAIRTNPLFADAL